MLRVAVINPSENRKFEHAGGPLEFGRGSQRSQPRCVVADPFVSRDHMRVEHLDDGRLRVQNLSKSSPLSLDQGRKLVAGESCELDLPVRIGLGKTQVDICSGVDSKTSDDLETVARQVLPEVSKPVALQDLGDSPDIGTLAHWFETVIAVQQAAAGSKEFYLETARAVVDLVGLDRGLVLLRKNDDWQVAAMHAVEDNMGPNYSRGILAEVAHRRRTFYRNLDTQSISASLTNIEAVVAAPVFDKHHNVVGVVYGSRSVGLGRRKAEIRPLEAQIVQVLAAAVGAGLARERQQAEALRSQIQFEQFFSTELAHELARDARLLEGREREVTIVFSDVRHSTSIAEQLGPREVFRLMQDVMELQTSKIREFEGVVVDYYGDGLLAMWNAPTDQADHAARACRAALAIRAELPRVGQEWNDVLDQPLDVGIGINTGLALVGNTGSRVKFKYGPIGPAVNLAHRVEHATKHLGVSVLITDSTRSHLNGSFATRRLCRARLAGIANPVDLYELHCEKCSPEWSAHRDSFEAALDHYESRRWAEACKALYPLLSEEEGQYDMPSMQLLSRAVECMKSVPGTFDPVMNFEQF